MDLQYVRFFHGRNTPDEELNDWGFDGPIVGPVQVRWTYGSIKLYEPGAGDLIHLPQFEDMIHLTKDGKDVYFGDMTIFSADDLDSSEVISFEQFKKIYNIKR